MHSLVHTEQLPHARLYPFQDFARQNPPRPSPLKKALKQPNHAIVFTALSLFMPTQQEWALCLCALIP